MYWWMNAGEPLNEIEAEQMMKEADKDGNGTTDYECIWTYFHVLNYRHIKTFYLVENT